MESTETYVRQEMATDVAKLLEAIDAMKEDLVGINSDLIPADQLPTIARGLKQLRENMERARLVTIIAMAMSKGGE